MRTQTVPQASPRAVNEVFARICEVERKHDLLQYQIDGWCVWPLMRFEVAQMLTALSLPRGAAGIPRASRARLAARDAVRLLTAGKARHLVKTYTSGLVERVGDRYSDVWFDDVLLSAGSAFKIETINNLRFLPRSRKALIPADVSNALLDAVASVMARRRPNAQESSVAERLAAHLQTEFALPDIDETLVVRHLQRFAADRRVFSALLRRVRPKFVLVADSGEHALVAAARAHDATVLDFQHGINDRTHPGYSWTAYAKPYRSRMTLPDRLLLYGEHWRHELETDAFWGDALRVVGSPRIDKYRSCRATRSRAGCTVLFTTQGIDVNGVARFLHATLEKAAGRVPLRLVIKLHPIFDPDKDVYLEPLAAFRDVVEVLAGDEGPSTFELMQEAAVHLSVSSAAHYDALGLGVPTVILPFAAHEIVDHLHRERHATLVHTPDDLFNVIAGWRQLRVPQDVSAHYFEPNAIANIRRELDLEAQA